MIDCCEGDYVENNDWLILLIKDYVNNYQQLNNTRTVWKDPLVAVADACDPEFVELKKQVGPNHLMVQDLLPGARSVICYFLPFVSNIGRSNKPSEPCSDQWAFAYLETNQLIKDLNIHIQKELTQKGYLTVVTPATRNFDKKTLLSNWSHRHVAVIAGLGTMGLNRMLITAQGCSGRLGSLVTDMPLTPTPRSDVSACLYTYNKSCLQCIKNCPQSALQENQFDRCKCYELLLQNAEIHADKGFADACGKCLSYVPCSFTNPVKQLLAKRSTH